jgi:predicted acyltransferase
MHYRPENQRLLSIDALRGFDMFWIIGGDYLAHALADATAFPAFLWLSAQMRHADWIGVNLYDLVFPLFMFLSGASAAIVLSRKDNSKAPSAYISGAAKRALILILLGIAYNWGWDITAERFRIPSVLGLIGVAYLIAIIILVTTKFWPRRAMMLVAIWGFVALLQLATPVPGFGAGDLTAAGSINGWIDRTLLPGRLYGGAYDPEGLLGMISGASITLAGAFAGALLVKPNKTYLKKAAILAGAGIVLMLAGLALAPYYPPIKKLWTVTFDLIAIGACNVFLAFFITLIEQLRLRRWATFFAVIGANSIAIYMVARFFAYPVLMPLSTFDGSIGLRILGIVAILAVEWGLLFALYRKRIFVKV